MMFERPYIQQLINRLNEPRTFIQVLMGPRQVGKSTLTVQVLSKLAPFMSIHSNTMTGSVRYHSCY